MEYTYQGLVRYSFGFANPNHAAAMLAILIPFFWGMRKIFTGRIAFSCIFIPEILLYLALIATISRTGIISVILGGALFFYLTHKHWGQRLDRKSLLLTTLIAASALIILLAFGMLKRHYAWICSPDGSILNRLILWQGGLQMLADNPSGVGTGYSGLIFTGFYQPYGANLAFRTMVNSFLTFAVEQGVLLSFIAAVPLIFSFAASFISLRCEMSDRMKYLLISMMTSCFCALISGMSSTCFDLSVIAGTLSLQFSDLNSVLQALLCMIPAVTVSAMIIFSHKHLKPFHLKASFLLAIAISTMLVLGALTAGSYLNLPRNEACSISTVQGVKWMNVHSKASPRKKILIMNDDRISSLNTTINFFRMKHSGYLFECPLYSAGDTETMLNRYSNAILCGRNAALANPESKTEYVFYQPASFIEMEPEKILKVYLNPFDKYGCNKQWETLLSGYKWKIER